MLRRARIDADRMLPTPKKFALIAIIVTGVGFLVIPLHWRWRCSGDRQGPPTVTLRP